MAPRAASVLFILSVLVALLAAPVAAQDDASAVPEATVAPAIEAPAATEAPTATVASTAPAEPTASVAPILPPLPTAMPVEEGPLAQAVLFFSPTCGHCHTVITETFPPLFADHGGDPVVTYDRSTPADEVAFYLMSNGRLQVLLVDVSQPDGSAMFSADTSRLDNDSFAVPRLDVGSDYLIGSGDIPDQFPGMVEQALNGDGMAWPAVPGLEQALASFVTDGSVPDPAATAEPGASAAAHDPFAVIPVGDGEDEDPFDKVARDPVGNGVSIVVLILLVISLVAAPLLAMRGSLPAFPGWLVIVLSLVGMAVAAYLANVETSGSEAVCGPVGDCNAVQESEYAELFGIPIGVLGVAGYLAIGGLWLVSRVANGALADWALVLIALGALGGTAFSAYLTFLEPFVIGATCMWCITSAIVMMVLLWISAGPGWSAWQRLRGDAGAPAQV